MRLKITSPNIYNIQETLRENTPAIPWCVLGPTRTRLAAHEVLTLQSRPHDKLVIRIGPTPIRRGGKNSYIRLTAECICSVRFETLKKNF